MSDFDDIQRLIRLKRHEQPPEDFVDDFVRSFQQRQRAELLQSSARGLLWERMETYFEGFFAPKLAWATAAVAVVGVGWLAMKPAGEISSSGSLAQHAVPSASVDVAAAGMPITDQEVAEYLLSRHYDGIFANEERRPVVQSPQFEQPFDTQHGGLLPVGFTLEPQR
ncbi:hypothetical protein FEM03_10955 [Phragmitibacter flavus]|uniref:Uncharacterized protein n=1 Tax=Phragmitibacter flavus TaxID=2576071 RepID=A0A5R8KEU7_9BACT|nr:hypothetical protein [Phragmitibacter flavus]TLD70818.1 hypothetical protein FEM03_10955 [Phragmitibacter flavus]